MVLNDKPFAAKFQLLTENYQKWQNEYFQKMAKELEEQGENPIENKNYDKDVQCLWYINGKIQFMIIADIQPILNLWRKLKIFEPVEDTNLNHYEFDLKRFSSDEEYGENVEAVHMYISSMNFWRDNGNEYV